ncbi:hypothetical protein N9174_01150 [bacterium]|nr:hypothetical protein [bacterium]
MAAGVTHIGFIPNVLIISNWFFRHRALALGIANAGRGTGALILLSLIQYAIQKAGWRHAFSHSGPMSFCWLRFKKGGEDRQEKRSFVREGVGKIKKAS